MALRKAKDPCKLAHQLNMMPARRIRLRHNPDLTDQAPQDPRRRRPRRRPLQCLGQATDLLAIAITQRRVQPKGRGLGRFRQLGRQLHLQCLQRLHLRLHRRVIHSVLNRRQEARDLRLGLRERLTGGVMIAAAPPGGLVEGQAIGLDEGRDQLGMHQPITEPAQHPFLQVLASDRRPVRADGCTAVARPAAAKARPVDHRVSRPAAIAAHQPRQQVIRPLRAFRPRAWIAHPGGVHRLADAGLSRLHPIPERRVDDPKVRHLGRHPHLRRVQTRLALARIGVLYEALPLPDLLISTQN
ncbi:hypothetical protein ABG193_12220 [Paracoccus marcusii]